MNHLLRELAPVSDESWRAIEEEATRTLKHFLTARRVVDFNASGDWTSDSVPRGRVEPAENAPEGVHARVRVAQPLVEYRVPFTLPREVLDSIDRGAQDPDLDNLVDAARRLAIAEDEAVFRGNRSAGITGIAEATTHPQLIVGDDYRDYPGHVARATAMLQTAGVAGPYAVALGPRCYTGVIETTEMGGYPVLEHLRLIAGGPVLWAPAVDGAIVLSQRGGDYALHVGEDASIGYEAHDTAGIYLYFEESFTFQVLTPEAAVHLAYD